MDIQNIFDPVLRGELKRKKVIEKAIKAGIKDGNKRIKEKVKKGEKRVVLYDFYLSTVEYNYNLTREEVNYIKENVEKYFKEKGTYEIYRHLDYGFGGKIIGWYVAVIIKK